MGLLYPCGKIPTLDIMSNEKHNTINDHEFTLIGDFFKDIDRQGPCSEEQTLKALDFCGVLPDNAQIADLGCGTGGQTINLAWNTNGHITAIDLMPAFTESLRRKIAGTKLDGRITVLDGSMDDLPFEEESLDVIWCEGAIYHIGFEVGLKYFHKFLKPGGIVVASEVSWYKETPPAEIASFWNDNYPGIDTIPVKVAGMQAAGFTPVAHFVMPERCWWNYFWPMEAYYEPFLEKYGHSGPALNLVESFKHEIDLYSRYKEYYGYVFYIGRK